MNRIFNFFSLIISMFYATNGLFACNVRRTKNESVIYGVLRKETKHNPLNPQNPHVAILDLDEDTQDELIAQIEQICIQRITQRGTVCGLGLDYTLHQLSKQGQQKLFDYLDENNYKLDRASREVLVNSFRESFNKYKAYEEQTRWLCITAAAEQLQCANSWNAALNDIANTEHFELLAKNANWQNSTRWAWPNNILNTKAFQELEIDEDWKSLVKDIDAQRNM
jgi:hypothetical protein